MSGSWCTYWQQVGMLYFTQKYKELHIYNRWRMSCIRYWELGINESSTNVIYKYPPSFLTLPGFYQLVCYTVWIEACARQYSPMKQRRQVALASSSILLLCCQPSKGSVIPFICPFFVQFWIYVYCTLCTVYKIYAAHNVSLLWFTWGSSLLYTVQ